MSSTHHRARGNFISALRDLVPVIKAEPEHLKTSIAKRSPTKRRPKRHINDHLACHRPKD